MRHRPTVIRVTAWEAFGPLTYSCHSDAILRVMEPNPPEKLTFPCDYPIKVMVRAEAGVRAHVDAILERHAGPIDLTTVTERPSAQQRFIGITYVIRAQNQEHIATLFEALKLCPQVLLVL